MVFAFRSAIFEPSSAFPFLPRSRPLGEKTGRRTPWGLKSPADPAQPLPFSGVLCEVERFLVPNTEWAGMTTMLTPPDGRRVPSFPGPSAPRGCALPPWLRLHRLPASPSTPCPALFPRVTIPSVGCHCLPLRSSAQHPPDGTGTICQLHRHSCSPKILPRT